MRSDVSSRRRRRGGAEEGNVAGRGDVGGEGRVVDVVGSVGGDGVGEGIVPDSRRTVDSSEGGGRRYESQRWVLRFCLADRVFGLGEGGVHTSFPRVSRLRLSCAHRV